MRIFSARPDFLGVISTGKEKSPEPLFRQSLGSGEKWWFACDEKRQTRSRCASVFDEARDDAVQKRAILKPAPRWSSFPFYK